MSRDHAEPTPESGLRGAPSGVAQRQVNSIALDAKGGNAALFDLLVRLLNSVELGVGRLALAIFLGTAALGSSVALMALAAWLLSRAAEMPPVMYLTAAAVGVRFFGIARGVFRYFERLVGHDLALGMQGSLREQVYDRLSRITLLGRRRGDLLMRVTADVDAVMDMVVRVILPFASAATVALSTTMVITVFSPGSAGMLLLSCVIAGLLLPWWGQRLSARADAAAVPARGRLADDARELARCAPDLVAYGMAGPALAKAQATDLELRRAESKGARMRGLATGAQLLAAGLAVISAILIGGPAVANGSLLGRDLAVLVLTPLALHESFGDLVRAAQTMTRARSALERVRAVLTTAPVGSGDRQFGDGDQAELIATDLDAGWPGEAPVLRGVQLDVRPGHRVAVTGPSGLGKTTLAATVLGLIPPLGGELVRPDRIGYLAQQPHIFATTIDENVRIGNKDANREQVIDALARAGLQLDPDRIVGEEGATLSGGEAHRVAVARLLVSPIDYQLVILDEPTEHLDHDTAQALLDDLFGALGDAAVLVITHDPQLMARCDQRVDLDQFAAAGKHAPHVG